MATHSSIDASERNSADALKAPRARCYVLVVQADHVGVTRTKSWSALTVSAVLVGLGLLTVTGYFSVSHFGGLDAGLASGHYVAIGDESATLLTLTVDGTKLAGTIDATTLTGTEIATQHISLTGTVNEDSGTLTLTQALGVATHLSGHMDEGSVVLSVPQDDGTLAEVRYRSGSIAEFNTAVAELQRRADAERAAQEAIAHQGRLDAAVRAAAENVRDSLRALRNASFGDTWLDEDMATLREDLQVMRNDMEETRQEPNAEARCSWASAVVADAEAIHADYEATVADYEAVESTAQELRAEIKQAREGLQALEEALAANPQYREPVPTEADVNSVVSTVRRLIDTTMVDAEETVQEARSLADQALREAKAFETRHCG